MTGHNTISIRLVMMLLLGSSLVANGVARLVGAETDRESRKSSSGEFDLRQLKFFQEQAAGDTGTTKRRLRVMRTSGLIAAVLESVVGALLILGLLERASLIALMALLGGFSVFLVAGERAGWPITDCDCFAASGSVPLQDHLLLNGVLILVVGALMRRSGN